MAHHVCLTFEMTPSVRLVSYSQGFVHTEDPSPKTLTDMICYCARVSNPANQHNYETQDRLLRYLMEHHHWSPFEMVSICLEIETTRDIARQILRHRSFSFQEFSQRYATVDVLSTSSIEYRPARLQDSKNRQQSHVSHDSVLENEWVQVQESIQRMTQQAYDWALGQGIAKEVARVVLPEGMTPSRLYMNGTLRSWIHYLQLRTEQGTQSEHRQVALACAHAIEPIFPLIIDFIDSYV